jgi:hypothetical protein
VCHIANPPLDGFLRLGEAPGEVSPALHALGECP